MNVFYEDGDRICGYRRSEMGTRTNNTIFLIRCFAYIGFGTTLSEMTTSLMSILFWITHCNYKLFIGYKYSILAAKTQLAAISHTFKVSTWITIRDIKLELWTIIRNANGCPVKLQRKPATWMILAEKNKLYKDNVHWNVYYK